MKGGIDSLLVLCLIKGIKRRIFEGLAMVLGIANRFPNKCRLANLNKTHLQL
jgi:hypothetical protein